MNRSNPFSLGLLWAGIVVFTFHGFSQTASAASPTPPYKLLSTTQVTGKGGIDYVYADRDGDRLYVPRGDQILSFDLDTFKPTGAITNAKARGVAVAPKFHHGFSSSSPVVMWNSKNLEVIKTIPVQGRPDGIIFEPATERIYVFSHSQPNATVIEAKDGSVVGTIDLEGAPEQAVSDERGHLFVAIEDKDNVAVVDANTLKVTAHYDLGGKGGGPAGLALDAKNQILFAFCRKPQTCVILSATDGNIITALPIGRGSDGGGFNPKTMEAFSSQGDGTLTVIKENSPTSFEVVQTIRTKPRAKTCTFDAQSDRIILIAIEPEVATAATGAATQTPTAPQTATGAGPTPVANQLGGNARDGSSGLLDIIVVGR